MRSTVAVTKALFWQAKLDGYGQSVDQRVKFAGGMKEFTKRGSNLVLVINNVDLRTSTVTARPMIWCSLLPARERNRGLRSLVILPWSFRLTRWRPQTQPARLNDRIPVLISMVSVTLPPPQSPRSTSGSESSSRAGGSRPSATRNIRPACTRDRLASPS